LWGRPKRGFEEKVPADFPVSREFGQQRPVRGGLHPPPGSPRFAEISRQRAKSPELAGFRADPRSLQLINFEFGAWYGAFVSGPKIPFPGKGDRRDQRLCSRSALCRRAEGRRRVREATAATLETQERLRQLRDALSRISAVEHDEISRVADCNAVIVQVHQLGRLRGH
jgi:hypothetical protein